MTRSNDCSLRLAGSSDEPPCGSSELHAHSSYPPRRWRAPLNKGGLSTRRVSNRRALPGVFAFAEPSSRLAVVQLFLAMVTKN